MKSLIKDAYSKRRILNEAACILFDTFEPTVVVNDKESCFELASTLWSCITTSHANVRNQSH